MWSIKPSPKCFELILVRRPSTSIQPLSDIIQLGLESHLGCGRCKRNLILIQAGVGGVACIASLPEFQEYRPRYRVIDPIPATTTTPPLPALGTLTLAETVAAETPETRCMSKERSPPSPDYGTHPFLRVGGKWEARMRGNLRIVAFGGGEVAMDL